MTRPQAASDRFVAQMGDVLREKLTVLHSPLIRIVPCDGGIETGDARGLVFTSSNGVAVAADKGVDRGLPCFCVGEATTRAAQAAGWAAECMGETADALIAALPDRKPLVPLLHLSGVHVRGDLAGALTQLGLPARAIAVYDQVLDPLDSRALSAVQGDKPVIAPLFSPRTARHFANQIDDPGNVHAVALSKAVAEPLKNRGFCSVTVAQRPNSADMITAIENLAERLSRVEGTGGAQ
ncbi:uroporphyrinogen-III synthase [Arenibacterium sp. CAU 1754]